MIIPNPLATNEQIGMINESLKKMSSVCSGIKACTKEILKESKGLIVLTADTTPMDLITHIPTLCEEKGVKYIFVEKKDQLENSYTCVFLDKENALELYESIKKIN